MVCHALVAQGKLYICMEYAPGGNLYDYIRMQDHQLLEEQIWRLFIQVRVLPISEVIWTISFYFWVLEAELQ